MEHLQLIKVTWSGDQSLSLYPKILYLLYSLQSLRLLTPVDYLENALSKRESEEKVQMTLLKLLFPFQKAYQRMPFSHGEQTYV